MFLEVPIIYSMDFKQNHHSFLTAILMKSKTLLFILIAVSFADCQSQNIQINIDASVKYQTIDNFGASDAWWAQKVGGWFLPNKEKVADLLFSETKGIGLSAWRFNVGGGINTTTITDPWRTVATFEVGKDQYDWTRQANERWFLQAAKKRGVKQFIAFVNSPPGRMTKNGYTNCTDGLGTTNLKSGYEKEYAKYLTDILKHFQDSLGITFNYISPVNEPEWEWNAKSNQEGNRASNDDIKRIVKALYSELKSQGVPTEINLIESGALKHWYLYQNDISSKYGAQYGNYLYDIFVDTTISNKVAKILGGHSYGSDLISTQLTQEREQLKSRIDPFLNNGRKYWVTEYTVLQGPNGEGGNGRDLSINTAINVARIIHYDLTTLSASAWQWWLAVSPYDYKDGLLYTDYHNAGDYQSIIPSKTLWAVGNFSKFIRPGSLRIQYQGADDKYGLMASSYLDEANNRLVIVLINAGTDKKDVQIKVSGLDSGKVITAFTPFVTSDDPGDNLTQYASFEKDSTYIVKPRSVVTLIGNLDGTILSSVKDQPMLPLQLNLFPNFPNPFNPSSIITFQIPESGNIRLTVYNALGQKIAVLLNKEMQAGIHTFHWNADNLESGVYFYNLQYGNMLLTRKAVLLK